MAEKLDAGSPEKLSEVEESSIESGLYTEGHGDLQILRTDSSSNVKVAKDGQTVLIPQPSDDPDDPLNWSFGKKHMVLASMVFASLVRHLHLEILKTKQANKYL
jgi:hypothetical protein